MTKHEATIVRVVDLEPHHARTGHTRHYAVSEQLRPPARLIIVQYGEREFNLIHLDAMGHEMTDTFHETVQDAMEQASLEFLVVPEEWATSDCPY